MDYLFRKYIIHEFFFCFVAFVSITVEFQFVLLLKIDCDLLLSLQIILENERENINKFKLKLFYKEYFNLVSNKEILNRYFYVLVFRYFNLFISSSLTAFILGYLLKNENYLNSIFLAVDTIGFLLSHFCGVFCIIHTCSRICTEVR